MVFLDGTFNEIHQTYFWLIKMYLIIMKQIRGVFFFILPWSRISLPLGGYVSIMGSFLMPDEWQRETKELLFLSRKSMPLEEYWDKGALEWSSKLQTKKQKLSGQLKK